MHLDAAFEVRLALTCDYGQRAAAQEIAHARKLCDHFGIVHRVLPLTWISEFPSGLTDRGSELPHPSLKQLDEMEYSTESAKAVWVPNRNGILLEAAAGFAESLGATTVIVGFNREEAATFPDNSTAYLDAINAALEFSTQGRVKVASPTASLDKRQIVAWARAHDFPLELVWSCYEARETMCGVCESCQRLQRALDNGFEDSTSETAHATVRAILESRPAPLTGERQGVRQ